MGSILTRVSCSFDQHGLSIMDIFNDVIANSTALYEFEPRTTQGMRAWFSEKAERGFPVLGAVDGSGQLVGFVTYAAFREKPACRLSVEHSLYVQASSRGAGVGSAMLEWIIIEARLRGCHTLVGAIDAENRASINLHGKHGFVRAGVIHQAAFKFGRWLDLEYHQLLLNPAAPAPVS